MSRRWGEGVRGLRAVQALALAAGLALVTATGVGAQATPEGGITASPAAGPCEAPEGMAGTAATPVASPVASPIASPMATPAEAAGAEPVGTPVDDQALVEEVTAAAENFANCWNEGNVDAVIALGTPNLLQTRYGIESAEEAAEALGREGALPPIAIISTGDVQTYDDGRASLELEYLLGDHQYTAAQWFMVEADNRLLIDQEELVLPQPDVEASTVIGVVFADDESPVAYVQGADEAGGREVGLLPAIILNADNTAGTTPRFLSVVRLEDAPAGTPAAGAFPEDGEFVAQLSVPAGDQVDVALVNLEPGSYVIGEMGGESVPLTITEAEA